MQRHREWTNAQVNVKRVLKGNFTKARLFRNVIQSNSLPIFQQFPCKTNEIDILSMFSFPTRKQLRISQTHMKQTCSSLVFIFHILVTK